MSPDAVTFPEITILPVVLIDPTDKLPVDKKSVKTLSDKKLLAVIVEASTRQKNASPEVAFV
jgi:hypothetical protein